MTVVEERLAEALRAVEWQSDPYEGHPYCAAGCSGEKPQHAEGCPVGYALTLYDATQTPAQSPTDQSGGSE